MNIPWLSLVSSQCILSFFDNTDVGSSMVCTKSWVLYPAWYFSGAGKTLHLLLLVKKCDTWQPRFVLLITPKWLFFHGLSQGPVLTAKGTSEHHMASPWIRGSWRMSTRSNLPLVSSQRRVRRRSHTVWRTTWWSVCVAKYVHLSLYRPIIT